MAVLISATILLCNNNDNGFIYIKSLNGSYGQKGVLEYYSSLFEEEITYSPIGRYLNNSFRLYIISVFNQNKV